MMRLSLMTVGTFVLVGAFAAAQGQAARPGFPGQRPEFPAQRPTPSPAPQEGSQQQYPSPPATAQPGTTGQPAAQPGIAGQPAQPVTRAAETPVNPTTPATPPVVTFRDGLLTVQAMNSNLSSVVTAIRNKTGIEFEGTENISERVALSLGPAPAGEVLSAIFSGSKYDFVAIGRPDNPSIVQRVLLTVKNHAGAATQAQTQTQPANQGEEDENPDETVNAGGGDPQDTAVQPVQPLQQQAAPPETQQQQAPSPEQLLQEMQQMQKDKNPAPSDGQNPAQVPRKRPPPQ
jgi:hypothetical protein